jgi:hypothetical protein
MADDLSKPEVCVCNEEVAFAIADWGRKSIAEKESLAITVAFLECLFRDRLHMVKKTPEEKEQMQERAKIGKELNKLYLKLLEATHPADDDVVIPSSATKKPPSTPSTPVAPATPPTPSTPGSEFTPSTSQYDPSTYRSPPLASAAAFSYGNFSSYRIPVVHRQILPYIH